MAHYDCTDCGNSMGIAYGICSNCTPKIVREKEEEFKNAVNKASHEFYQMVGNSLRRKIEEKEQKYIDKKVGKLRSEFKSLFEYHKTHK